MDFDLNSVAKNLNRDIDENFSPLLMEIYSDGLASSNVLQHTTKKSIPLHHIYCTSKCVQKINLTSSDICYDSKPVKAE